MIRIVFDSKLSGPLRDPLRLTLLRFIKQTILKRTTWLN